VGRILLNRSEEVKRRILVGLASFDCLTLNQCVSLVYWKHTPSGFSSTQRKLKSMLSLRLIGRKKSKDNIFRYFLQTSGVREAEQYINFLPAAGNDRSYLNSSRNDKVIDRIIADLNLINNESSEGIALGRGALRHIKDGRYSAVDGLLGITINGTTKTVKVYVKIDCPNLAGQKKYQESVKIANSLKSKIFVVANPFTLKNLGIK